MSATRMRVGNPLPKIAQVRPLDGFRIQVRWAGEVEGKTSVAVDLAPAIFTYKFYRPIRENRVLFETVHVIDNGTALAWGDEEDFDMAATTVARLAAEGMEPSDFAAFLQRNNFTFDRAAAELGISRRLVAYYASEREVPRYIALACAHLDQKAKRMLTSSGPQKQERRSSTEDDIAEVLKAIQQEAARIQGNYSFTKISDHDESVQEQILKKEALSNSSIVDLHTYKKASRR